MAVLFDSLDLGAIALPNRIVMAPLTRARAGRDAVPNALMAAYYARRATAGLLITEATGISREGRGWPNAPGLWNQAQVEGWSQVTSAVHHAGGRIAAQLWHMGRLAHPDLGGGQPVGSSATTARTLRIPTKARSTTPKPAPRQPTTSSGSSPITQQRRATRSMPGSTESRHGANGYLVDQFLRGSANFRTDKHGGPIDNACAS